jgi:hypothetical protein
MNGLALLALVLSLQTAFLYSVATPPTAEEAAASLAPAEAAPELVHHDAEIVVRT